MYDDQPMSSETTWTGAKTDNARTPGVLQAIEDLRNKVNHLEKIEDVLRGKFGAVAAEDSPRAVSELSMAADKPRGSSPIHNDLVDLTNRLGYIAERLGSFAERSEVG